MGPLLQLFQQLWDVGLAQQWPEPHRPKLFHRDEQLQAAFIKNK
jgi:hypothetical protein